MSLTDEEKAKVRHHLGYANVSEAASFQLGIPAAIQTQFMIELAWDKVLPAAENLLKILICRMDDVEREVYSGLDLASLTKTGAIEVNPKRLNELGKHYCLAQQSLSNLVAVPPNPFDARSWIAQSGGGMNVRVMG